MATKRPKTSKPVVAVELTVVVDLKTKSYRAVKVTALDAPVPLPEPRLLELDVQSTVRGCPPDFTTYQQWLGTLIVSMVCTSDRKRHLYATDPLGTSLTDLGLDPLA